MPDPEAETGEVVLTVRAHWVNCAVLHPFARPYVGLAGVEHVLTWGQPSAFAVPAGEVEVSTFVRYKVSDARLGIAGGTFTVPPGGTVRLFATNSFVNSTPFTPRAATGRPRHDEGRQGDDPAVGEVV